MSDSPNASPERIASQPVQEATSIERPDEHPLEQDERAIEQSAEYVDDVLHAEEDAKSGRTTSNPPTEVQSAVVRLQKDEIVVEVEKILEDGIGPFYEALSPESKTLFKTRGEAVAKEVAEMVRTFRVHARRLIRLISDWLKTIPGINKYFLEQEAKIKADRIIQLIDVRKEEKSHEV